MVTVPAGTTVHDKATLAGAFGTPTGTVTFTFFTASSACTGASVGSGTVTLDASGVAHPSASQGPLSAGSYSFIAIGRASRRETVTDSPCEPLTVTALTPTALTEIHDASHTPVVTVPAGTTVHDKATVSGSFGTPTGTVTFTFFTASSACTGASVGSGTVTLDASGVAHPSASQGPLSAGSYSFIAHYNGDLNYTATDSPCEPQTHTAVTPSPLTQIHDASHTQVVTVPAGTTVHDKATLAGAFGTPTGTVTFTFFTASSACTGASVGSGTVTLVALRVALPIASQGPLSAGSYSFIAHYNGDLNYTATDSPCEPQTHTAVTPSPLTQIHDASHTQVVTVPAGTTVHDKATLAGAFGTPTGTVTFTFFTASSACTGASVGSGTVTLVALRVALPISSQGPLSAGSYSFIAHYNGDLNYTATDSPCEPLTEIGRASCRERENHDAGDAAVTTVPAGTTVHDKATVGGTFGTPTGTVTFTFFTASSAFIEHSVGYGILTLVACGVVLLPSSQGPLSAGSYSFIAHYNGDLNYTATDSPCEPLTVTALTPTVATEIHDASHAVVASVPAGSTVHDKATVSGSVGTPTGTVTFTFLTASSACTGASVGSVAVTLDASRVAHPSASQPSSTPFSYSFIAHYNGDLNYTATDSPCEPLTVTALTPTALTEIHDASHTPVVTVPAGTTVHDKATLAGAFGMPTGTVTFTFFTASSACTGASVGSGTVTLDASGVAHPSASQGPLSAGSYSFLAHYNGDLNYTATDSPCEPLTVTGSADLSITKTDNPDPVNAGATLTYTVTVTNGGPSTAANVQVTDNLPAGVTFQSASGTGWTCMQAAGVVTCTRGSVVPGGAPPITITVTPALCGTITNRATVSSTTIDPSAANNTATTSTTVQCLPGKVTGGGEIRVPKGSNGKDFANFGFVVQRMALNGPAIGQLQYFNHARLVDVHSTGMLTLLIVGRSEEHTSELQSRQYLVCRLLLE